MSRDIQRQHVNRDPGKRSESRMTLSRSLGLSRTIPSDNRIRVLAPSMTERPASRSYRPRSDSVVSCLTLRAQRAALAQHIAFTLFGGHSDQAGALAKNHLRKDPPVALLGNRNRFDKPMLNLLWYVCLAADDTRCIACLSRRRSLVNPTEMPGSG